METTIELSKILMLLGILIILILSWFALYCVGYKKGYKDGVNITNRIRDIDDKTKSEVENGNDN